MAITMGAAAQGVEFLRIYTRQYRHALLIFDHEGSGGESETAESWEARLDGQLADIGWENRARAIVIEPELEAWVWSASSKVDEILGWRGRTPALREWLANEKFVTAPQAKPARPKEALLAALQLAHKPVSGAVFRELAEKVSFKECRDRSFLRFAETLREWFSEQNP